MSLVDGSTDTPSAVDHRPDHPFGCAVSWGPVVGGILPDAKQHVCNRQYHKKGRHVCKCGVSHSPAP